MNSVSVSSNEKNWPDTPRVCQKVPTQLPGASLSEYGNQKPRLNRRGFHGVVLAMRSIVSQLFGWLAFHSIAARTRRSTEGWV